MKSEESDKVMMIIDNEKKEEGVQNVEEKDEKVDPKKYKRDNSLQIKQKLKEKINKLNHKYKLQNKRRIIS